MTQQEENEGKDGAGGRQCMLKYCGVNAHGLLDDAEVRSGAE